MKNCDLADERLFEKCLKQAAEKASMQDYLDLEGQAASYAYSFSPEFERKMDGLMAKHPDARIPVHAGRYGTRRRSRGRRMRVLLIAAAVLLLNVAAVLANEELREKVGNIIMGIYEHSIDFKADTEEKVYDFEKYVVNYIPNGYDKIEEIDNLPFECRYVFENEKSDKIVYIQSIAEGGDFSVSYEESEKITVKVNGIEGVVVSDEDINTLFFEMDGYVFRIYAPLYEDTSELVKMAESISLKKR